MGSNMKRGEALLACFTHLLARWRDLRLQVHIIDVDTKSV